MIRRNQLRRRLGTEPQIIRRIVGSEQLHDAHPVLAVGHIRKRARRGPPELDVARVIRTSTCRVPVIAPLALKTSSITGCSGRSTSTITSPCLPPATYA